MSRPRDTFKSDEAFAWIGLREADALCTGTSALKSLGPQLSPTLVICGLQYDPSVDKVASSPGNGITSSVDSARDAVSCFVQFLCLLQKHVSTSLLGGSPLSASDIDASYLNSTRTGAEMNPFFVQAGIAGIPRCTCFTPSTDSDH